MIAVDFYTFEGSFMHLREFIHLRVQQRRLANWIESLACWNWNRNHIMPEL